MAAILMLGAFIGLFGETALNMALTNVMEQFSITAATAQWLTTGYLLTLAILVPISALLMKWFSTRQLVIGGLVISMAGAILAAFSPNFVILETGRIVQAMGTGIIMPIMVSVLLVILSTGIILPMYLKGSLLFSTAAAGLLLLLGNAVNVIMSPIV